MLVPLSFLDEAPNCPGSSLGEVISERLARSSTATLLDCFCSGSSPAIFSPDLSTSSLSHENLKTFILNFALPVSSTRPKLGRNDRIMIVLPSGPENAVVLLALSSYHSCAPVNASCTSEELKQDALRLSVKAIVTTPDIHKRLEIDTLEVDCQVFHVIPRRSGPAGLFDILLYGQVAISAPPEPTLPQRLEDVSLILHTSGTSGKKKVVRYTLRTLLVGTWCVVQSWKLTPKDVNLNMMPLFHVGGIVRNLLAPILSGGSTIVCSGFDSAAFWTLSTTLKATWYYAAPTVHCTVLLSRPENINPDRDTCIRLICNAAGGLLPSLALELKNTFKAIVLPSYGMTECMPIATPPTDYSLDRPGCSGIACGPQISIRDPKNLECEVQDGKIGAVCVRGTPTFDGYETSADPDVPLNTSEFSSESWFNSGDIGYLDQDGYLYITGRSKEIINKGGEVISPFEIEEAITTVANDCVKSTLAFSIEHDVLQETIGVLIVTVSGRPRISLSQLHDRLKGHLHPSKWPFVAVYIEDLPMNCAGKPLRISLAKRLGIEQLCDGIPSLQRHYEATLPDNPGDISTPIPCSRVTVDHLALDQALRKIDEVQDVALRVHQDGSVEAFVISKGGSAETHNNLANTIHGYSLPSVIYNINGHLVRSANGDVDFETMLATWSDKSAFTISDDERLVQNIFSDVLKIDPKVIRPDSDFFLLGGNSLLLGKLSYHLRKRAGVNIPVVDLFTDCSVKGVSKYIRAEGSSTPQLLSSNYELKIQTTRNSSATVFEEEYDYDRDPENLRAINGRGSTNLLCLIVQAIPYLTFFPLKFALTWATLLFILSYLSILTKSDYWHRMIALITAIIGARFLARVVCPLTAILFKWLVVWRYRPGKYKMWSTYHLRWWLVDQSLRIAGRGIFNMHPSLIVLYYRLLGARIGYGVTIDEDVRLYECDLIHLGDGCRIDSTCLRGFRLERDGYYTLAPTFIGERAVINASTYISPGTRVLPGEVYGPHASSHDPPFQKHFAAYNTTLVPKLNLWLKSFVACPLIFLVLFISYIPWMVAIFGMISSIHMSQTGLSDIEAIIYWFSDPQRILLHALSRVVYALFQPAIQVSLGILIKRLMGFNKEANSMSPPQSVLLKRYVCSVLLSQRDLKKFFSIIGTHYEGVSVVYRLMGAKIGKRIYWPGSGIICPEPELLEIGDDVVFGSRSSLITSTRLGSAKIVIEDGAMIADRVILLPGTKVGRRAVMGSGSLGKRNAVYPAGSTWIGNEQGEAVCLNAGNNEAKKGDTKTPFGQAFYERKADYFILPYSVVLLINIAVTILSAAYWSCNAVGAAQILRNVQYGGGRAGRRLFENGWYRYAILYGIIAVCFVVTVTVQGMLTVLWVIGTKWLIIGRRREGQYNWDKSSYCQRWQLHLTMSRLMYQGYGNGGVLAPLTGSVYMVWFYRALGAKIGKNCAIWAGGTLGLMTEPDLVELGDNVSLDDCSVVAHINSRGQFSLNRLKIAGGSTMRSGSRLLSGAAMEERSMLYEHTLLTSGEIADSDTSYVGWPARKYEDLKDDPLNRKGFASLMCPICRRFPKDATVTTCGHLFCHSCITKSLSLRSSCPSCYEPTKPKELTKVHLSFAIDEKTEVKC